MTKQGEVWVGGWGGGGGGGVSSENGAAQVENGQAVWKHQQQNIHAHEKASCPLRKRKKRQFEEITRHTFQTGSTFEHKVM